MDTVALAVGASIIANMVVPESMCEVFELESVIRSMGFTWVSQEPVGLTWLLSEIVESATEPAGAPNRVGVTLRRDGAKPTWPPPRPVQPPSRRSHMGGCQKSWSPFGSPKY